MSKLLIEDLQSRDFQCVHLILILLWQFLIEVYDAWDQNLNTLFPTIRYYGDLELIKSGFEKGFQSMVFGHFLRGRRR